MIQSVCSSQIKYLIYLEEQKQQKKVEDAQLCLLNNKVVMIDSKKNVVKESCNNYNKGFVEYMKKAEDQFDFTKMRVYPTKGNDLKRKQNIMKMNLVKLRRYLHFWKREGS